MAAAFAQAAHRLTRRRPPMRRRTPLSPLLRAVGDPLACVVPVIGLAANTALVGGHHYPPIVPASSLATGAAPATGLPMGVVSTCSIPTHRWFAHRHCL
ncbi:hypothetical protein GW17_00042034 [Ensete ventricosum]|nr:hypothetical protein GW17_00042034 [Ensete ventricosum]